MVTSKEFPLRLIMRLRLPISTEAHLKTCSFKCLTYIILLMNETNYFSKRKGVGGK